MQKRAFSYSLFHIGCFISNGLGFVMTFPQWVMFSFAGIWLVALGFHLSECREDIKRFFMKIAGKDPAPAKRKDDGQIQPKDTITEHGIITKGPTGYPERLTTWDDMKEGKLAPPPGEPPPKPGN